MAEHGPSLFIAATDTDAGKTWVTAHLIRMLRQQNKPAIAIKPIACGSDDQGNNSDIQTLLEHQPDLSISDINLYNLDLPAAPAWAAQQQGTEIDMNALLDFCKREHQGLRIIEGVGGVMVPVTPLQSGLEWIERLPSSNIALVVGVRLGCINHTLLSLQALQSINRTPKWLILNDLSNSGDNTMVTTMLQPHLSPEIRIIETSKNQPDELQRIIENAHH